MLDEVKDNPVKVRNKDIQELLKEAGAPKSGDKKKLTVLLERFEIAPGAIKCHL